MDMGVGGRGGARRRTRRRQSAAQSSAANQAPQAAPAQPASVAPVNQQAALLESLNNLYQAGILTDEEFSAKKVLVVEKF